MIENLVETLLNSGLTRGSKIRASKTNLFKIRELCDRAAIDINNMRIPMYALAVERLREFGPKDNVYLNLKRILSISFKEDVYILETILEKELNSQSN
jgi:hypothetical protein